MRLAEGAKLRIKGSVLAVTLRVLKAFLVGTLSAGVLAALLGYSLRHGFVSPARVILPSEGNQSSQGQAIGLGVEGLDTYCPLSAVSAARPRRRAVWVRRFEAFVGVSGGSVGKLLRGRWVPDLPNHEWNHAASLMTALVDNGVKILGGGSVQCVEGHEDQPYLVIEQVDGVTSVICVELLFRLSNYAFARERNAILAQSLKVRALDWCKKVGLSQADTYMAVSGAMPVAWQVSRVERYASAAMPVVGSTRYWWL